MLISISLLPNIIGRTQWNATYGGSLTPTYSGAFITTPTGTYKPQVTPSGAGDIQIEFKAFLSNAVYSKSKTVQPHAINIQYLIKY